MTRLLAFIALAAILSALPSTAPASSEKLWFHVTVVEQDPDGDTVRIHLPIEVVDKTLPMLMSEHAHGASLRFVDHDYDREQLRAILDAIRESPDGEFVTIESSDEHVRVRKIRERLEIHVVERGERPEETRIQIEIPVLSALLGDQADALDFVAALRVAAKKGGELVSIVSTDATVRVWIDNRPGEGN